MSVKAKTMTIISSPLFSFGIYEMGTVVTLGAVLGTLRPSPSFLSFQSFVLQLSVNTYRVKGSRRIGNVFRHLRPRL